MHVDVTHSNVARSCGGVRGRRRVVAQLVLFRSRR